MGSSAGAGIEERIRAALVRALAWAVDAPNDEAVWVRARDAAFSVLTAFWRQGELVGERPADAFYVRCGHDTMTQRDLDNGRMIVQVGIAPVAAGEFVIVQIEQMIRGRRRRVPLRRWFARSAVS